MLTLELLDLQKPLAVALNFIDELEKSGATVDADRLSEELGIPVVRISALKGINIDGLKQALKNARVPKLVPFNRSLENLIATLQNKDSLGRFEAISTISNEQTDMDEIMGHLDGFILKNISPWNAIESSSNRYGCYEKTTRKVEMVGYARSCVTSPIGWYTHIRYYPLPTLQDNLCCGATTNRFSSRSHFLAISLGNSLSALWVDKRLHTECLVRWSGNVVSFVPWYL